MKTKLENYYPLFKILSINNDINPTVDILIESIDRFSFGEDSGDEKTSKRENEEGKKKKEKPNNYSLMKTDNNLIESNSKLKDLNSIINNIEEIQMIQLEEKKNNKGKICGIFNKEDFEIKLDSKKNNHKNSQLNDSFEKKYNNPLKNFLDDDEDNNIENNININNNEPKINNNQINIKDINNEIKEVKEEKKDENNNNEKNNEIIINKSNKEENNLINSNSNIKIDNYESDDIKNPEIEKGFINNISPNNLNEKELMKISKDDDKEKDKEKKEESQNEKEQNIKSINESINKLNINNIKDNDNHELESPRLGRNFIEKEEIKKLDEEIIKEDTNSKENEKEKDNTKEKLEEKENNENINRNNNEEKQINIPLSINVDNIYKKVNDNIEEKKKEINREKKEEKNKILTDIKENSFIIQKTSNKEKKEKENDEANKKILELTQKLEQSEKESQIMKETNEKLIEVINMFKNLQSIETKKTPNSGKNSRSDTPKRQIIKKRCYTPTLSKTNNIMYGNGPVIHHKRSNSYNKIRVIKNNEHKLYIDYVPVKQKTYRQLHGKENNQKKEKKINQKISINNNPKMYGNYINRNTIYLTGASSNKYAKSPYLNNNMNYTGISYNNNLSNRKHKNSYNNYLNMNNSSHSFFINNNIDNTYGNIYQRQVMQLPPNEQPLFYETKSNINNNGTYHELIYNKNINYNSENNFNKHKNILENTNKYLQEMPYGLSNTNEFSLNNNIDNNNNNKNKKNKNKLLDFKDFLPIFDETSNTHKNKSIQAKADNKNIINNTLSKKNDINNNNNNLNENNDYNDNYPNNNYNLINYREYSNYNLNEFNNNLNKENNNNLEAKKNMEKLSKGIEDDNQKKKSKTKNDNINNLNFGIINNFNKNKKKNYKNNNSKNGNNNLNSKEFGRNREKIDYSNCFNDSDDFNGFIKEKKNNRKKENLNKLGKDYILPFYLINRNEMLNNIVNYISNDKNKKRVNNPINDKKKSN